MTEKPIKDFVLVHVIFAVLAAITLLVPIPTATVSGKMLALVMIYNGLIVVEFYAKGLRTAAKKLDILVHFIIGAYIIRIEQ